MADIDRHDWQEAQRLAEAAHPDSPALVERVIRRAKAEWSDTDASFAFFLDRLRSAI